MSGGATSAPPSPHTDPAENHHRSPCLRKPLWALERQEAADHAVATASGGHINRHLTLFDLVSVGVGGTVGSGIFVLCGVVAKNFAGPAVCLSWAIAGAAACLSGLCFAELAGKIPAEGSTYNYVYASMGELPAVVAAAYLTLEYGMSAAAVARSWGEKVTEWITAELVGDHWIRHVLMPGYGMNPMASVVSAASVALLLCGVKESKAVSNFFTVAKLALIFFMTVGGFLLMDTSNLKPFVPPQFGASGVFRGATSSFFGYLGYDEVCCIAGEAVNPKKDLPLAIIITLFTVTCLYISAALALTGMEPYHELNEMSAFPDAFRNNGVRWAAQIAAAGELLTLPIVVLIALMAQPRLQFALAQDGLLPKLFAQTDSTGNPRAGVLVSGIFVTLVATFAPFVYLDDLISAGILVAFSMTDCSLILLRHESPDDRPYLLEKLIVWYNGLAFVTVLLIEHISWGAVGTSLLVALSALLVGTAVFIGKRCPQSKAFGGKRLSMPTIVESNGIFDKFFETPFVPYLPCLGVFVNWYLVMQLEALGLFLLVLYTGLAIVLYFLFGAKNSLGNTLGWIENEYEEVLDLDDHKDSVMLRTISLPRVPHSD